MKILILPLYDFSIFQKSQYPDSPSLVFFSLYSQYAFIVLWHYKMVREWFEPKIFISAEIVDERAGAEGSFNKFQLPFPVKYQITYYHDDLNPGFSNH